MERKGVIYKIENLINGKVYIGQTIQNFKARKSDHIYELKNGRKRNIKLQTAWNKYGEANFKFSIIGHYPISELDKMEIYFISKYDSFKNGYNMTTGGNQVMHNQKHTKKTRIKISSKLKDIWNNPKFIKKMEKRPIYYGSESPHATKVICINDRKIFNSMIEAGDYYGISMKKVSSSCTNKCEYTGLEETGMKLQFAYYEEGNDYSLNEINHCNEKKKVKCITTGQIYNSITEAGKNTGTTPASISHVCKGKRKHAGGLEWEYI